MSASVPWRRGEIRAFASFTIYRLRSPPVLKQSFHPEIMAAAGFDSAERA
jgi:hypothetical protein